MNSPKHVAADLHQASAAKTSSEIFMEAMRQHQAANHDSAESLYRQVLAIDPDHVAALSLLSGLLAGRGLLGPAVDLVRKAIRLEPQSPEAHYNLGTMLLHLEQSDEALAAFGQAIALKPDYAKAYNNQGVALQNLRRNEEASAAHRRATELQPDFAQAHHNLGVALQNMKRFDEALKAYVGAIKLMPDYAEAYSQIGATLKELGRSNEAMAPCLRAIELAPDLAEAHNHLGNALRDLEQYEPSIAAYRRAIELRPDFAAAYANLSIALQEAGHSVEAREMVERSLKLDPGSAHGWYALSDMKTFAPADPDIDQMEALRASADARRLDMEDRVHILFALGKALLDAGNADRAFAHLHEGNRLKRSTFTHDADAAADRATAIARSCSSALLQEFADRGHPSDLPIFVVGMPRSGTTLIEQILASHPAVHGAGELRYFEDIIDGIVGPDHKPIGYPELLSELPLIDLAACGRAYVERVSALAPDKRRVIDKMPANYFFAGLIRLMLPNARIIHVRRDAVDTCLSCYMKKFTSGQNFTYDLRELGSAYRSYEALMQHWRAVLPPERFIEVQYEDVVGDLEAQARRLVAFCGLEWNEACLSFHKTSRPVRTASFNQVRQPLYRTSIGRWKPYAHHLEPLLAALRLTPGPD